MDRPSDHAIEQLVGRLLQIGVAISATVVMIGGAMLLARHGADVPVYTPFRGEPEGIRTLSGIISGAAAADARSIIQLGLLLLIATPIARVAFTLVAFIFQRDRLYIAITSVVLALLLYGLVSGQIGG